MIRESAVETLSTIWMPLRLMNVKSAMTSTLKTTSAVGVIGTIWVR